MCSGRWKYVQGIGNVCLGVVIYLDKFFRSGHMYVYTYVYKYMCMSKYKEERGERTKKEGHIHIFPYPPPTLYSVRFFSGGPVRPHWLLPALLVHPLSRVFPPFRALFTTP